MDFSGEQGRVVADPNEALGVAFEEGYNWRVSRFTTAFLNREPRPWIPSGHEDIIEGNKQIKLLKHILALCGLPYIFSKTLSLTTLAELHFIPQLEIQICNVILPTPVTFSCIFGVIMSASKMH